MAPYARVYLTIADDPKFIEVYDDDRLLATWLRLLLLAEGSHPASPPIPASADALAVTALVACGLIDLTRGGRYRVHGLDDERARRLAESRNGGVVRAETAARGPDGRFLPAGPALDTSSAHQRNQPAELRLDETSRATRAGTRATGAASPREGGGDDPRSLKQILHDMGAEPRFAAKEKA